MRRIPDPLVYAPDERPVGVVSDEGRHGSRFDEDRPEYQALLEHVGGDDVATVVVLNPSCDRKERLRLLLDLDVADVELHSHELGRAVNLDDDWELVRQSIKATTDDVEKRKEIERSKRATKERTENGYNHGLPPIGFQFDNALDVVALRKDGVSWREIATETGIAKDTARRVWDNKERYLKRK